jgi:hypothetical protein
VIKFLTALLDVIQKVFAFLDQHHWKQQGRQEAIKQAEKEIEEQISLGEAAVSIPDPDRTERLRNKYDRSRSAQ